MNRAISDPNFAVRHAEARIDLVTKQIQKNERKLSKVKERQQDLHRQAQELESEQRTLRAHLQGAQDELVKARGISSDVAALRELIVQKIEKSQSKSITVGTKEKLAAEIADHKKKLMEICDHRFTVRYPGYEGDYFDNYENSRHEVGICIVCSLSESVAVPARRGRDYNQASPDPLNILKKTPERLVISAYPSYSKEKRSSLADIMWNPFDQVLTEVSSWK